MRSLGTRKIALTRKQRLLKREIEDIAASIELDHWNILDYPAPTRTLRLEIIKKQMIRSQVVTRYTFIDECLTLIICNHYFYKPPSKKTYRDLWKTKRFKIFNHYIMDETYLLKKLSIVDAISKVPKEIASAIQRINDVRNAVAHSFFPENRRRYMAQKKVMYGGADIFENLGVDNFQKDVDLVQKYLWRRAFK
jgi:hypothetical protein